MKPRDFYKILIDFVEDDKRWRALKVGDNIYDEQSRSFEFDYHKMVIDEIDVDERRVKAHDVSGNHSDTLTHFLTEVEFVKRKH